MLRRLPGTLQSSRFCRVEQVCQKTSKTFGTGSTLKGTPSDEKASSTSEFLKSFGILLEERKKVSVVGRWDWHLWQLCAALLPALGVFALVQYARSDMRKEEAILLRKRQAKMAEDHASAGANTPKIPKDTAPDRSHDQLQAKVLSLEKALQKLQIQQLMRQAVLPDAGPKVDVLKLPVPLQKSGQELGPMPSPKSGLRQQAAAVTNTSEQDQPPAVPSGHQDGDRVEEDLSARATAESSTGQDSDSLSAQASSVNLREACDSPNTVSLLRQYFQQYRQQAVQKVSSLFSKQDPDADEPRPLDSDKK